MPTSVIHEIVGRKIATKYNYLDNYNFYLGNIAPDAVNLNGFAESKIRWEAHIRDANLSVWKNNAIKFYNDYKDSYDESFLKGYITHLFTDIIYDEKYYDRVVIPMVKINLQGHQAHLYMLKEMDAYGINNEDYKYVTNVLKTSNNTYNIRNINNELLLGWKEKITNKELPNIKDEFIKDFIIDELTNSVLEELQNNNIL